MPEPVGPPPLGLAPRASGREDPTAERDVPAYRRAFRERARTA